MKTGKTPPFLSECRAHARRLLKQLRSDSGQAAEAAAARLVCLRSLSPTSPAKLLAQRDRVRLKHALAVVATERGYASWRELKQSAEAPTAPAPGREMYDRGLDLLLNRWFARYEDARKSLERYGGFLFPFDCHFFVCEAEGVRVLGLDPDDADWERIGRDWVRPLDREAWSRLRAERRRVLRRLARSRREGRTHPSRRAWIRDIAA